MSGQRQDSLTEQMWDVIRLAEQAGCRDAADWLRARFDSKYDAALHAFLTPRESEEA